MPKKCKLTEKRFMDKIQIDPDSGCWLWQAAKTETGYGRFRNHDGKTVAAHRWAYENFKGKIPEGMGLDHSCRVRHCVNPEHLSPATQWQNVRRGNLTNAKTCKNGHTRTSENTMIIKKTLSSGIVTYIRSCRICARERNRETYRRRKAKEAAEAAS